MGCGVLDNTSSPLSALRHTPSFFVSLISTCDQLFLMISLACFSLVVFIYIFLNNIYDRLIFWHAAAG